MACDVRGRFKGKGTYVSVQFSSYVHLWLIHTHVWQKTTQHYTAIILQSKVNIFFFNLLSLSLEHYFYIEYFTNHFFLSKLYLHFPIFLKKINTNLLGLIFPKFKNRIGEFKLQLTICKYQVFLLSVLSQEA